MTETEKKALILVRRGRCASRAELSRALQVSRPTASAIVAELLACGALCESGRGKSRRGKSPTLLAPVAGYQYTIGLDLGYARELVGVLLDGQDRIIRQGKRKYDFSSPDEIPEKAADLVKELAADHVATGLGVALPGIVEEKTGKVIDSINPFFTAGDIGASLKRATGLPVTVENRSRAAACSEAFGGAADQQKNFILCSLGKSIGAAFWLNGRMFHGSHGAAGEIRCLRLSNGRTLEEALAIENVAGYTENELVALCAEGLHQLREIMDLNLVILTGRFTDFGSGFPEKLTRELSCVRPCRVLPSAYGRFSAARGVAVSMAEKHLAAE